MNNDIAQDISTSAICSIYPLNKLFGEMEINSPGWHWTNLKLFIIGLNDLRARSGTFTTPWNATSPYRCPMPDLSINESRSLNDLMDLRGQEIYRHACTHNKKIMVMWSGGIDSTSVIVSLLKAVPTNEQKDRIIICLSPDSVLENLAFYKNFISTKIPIVHRLTVNFNSEFLRNHILLHGDPGDALFGSSAGKYEALVKEGKHLLPYRDNVDLLYQCMIPKDTKTFKFPKESGQWIVDKIVANLDETQPERIKTIADWFWWQYVNFKWEGSLWRPFAGTGIRTDFTQPLDEEPVRQYLETTFFNTDYFQRWSYCNKDNFFPKGIASHKHEIKQYIVDFDHNEAYQNFKVKTASMGQFAINGLRKNPLLRPVYFDKNWVGHTLQDPEVHDTVLELLKAYKG